LVIIQIRGAKLNKIRSLAILLLAALILNEKTGFCCRSRKAEGRSIKEPGPEAIAPGPGKPDSAKFYRSKTILLLRILPSVCISR
jgi:hypothetical protein